MCPRFVHQKCILYTKNKIKLKKDKRKRKKDKGKKIKEKGKKKSLDTSRISGAADLIS
jgi:uncharacterized Fe-S cluster-containing radical SAM superfamily protein